MEVAKCDERLEATESGNFSDSDCVTDEEEVHHKRSIPMCQAISVKSLHVTATGQTGLSPKKGQRQI